MRKGLLNEYQPEHMASFKGEFFCVCSFFSPEQKLELASGPLLKEEERSERKGEREDKFAFSLRLGVEMWNCRTLKHTFSIFFFHL